MKKIFVAIASYRDPECQWTVKDLFEKAKYPERIFVGICWQFVAAEDQAFFQVETRPEQVRRLDFDVMDSKGCGWAKAESMKLWKDEEYVLIVDSHMRFEENWDEGLINILNSCPSEKSLISTHPAAYIPPNELKPSTPQLVAKEFNETSKILSIRSYNRKLSKPKRNAFIAGGFVFASAELFNQVPWDFNVYFQGEEIAFAVRAWTYGWDIYTPHICLVYHYYGRQEAIKHSTDHKQWSERANRSNCYVRNLVGTENSDEVIISSPFKLGSVRTLEEFQKFSGVDFKNMTLTDAASNGVVNLAYNTVPI